MGNVSKYVLREQEKEISLWHYGVPKRPCKETGLFGVWHTNGMPKVCTVASRSNHPGRFSLKEILK